MKIIVSATLFRKTLESAKFNDIDNIEVRIVDGLMTMYQYQNDEARVEALVHCPKDIGPFWMDVQSFLSLQKLLRVLGYDFPLVLEFDGSRIWAHFYL